MVDAEENLDVVLLSFDFNSPQPGNDIQSYLMF